MVFNLIGAGIFGKTEEDSIEDFKNVFDFHEAFVKPFEPEKRSHPDVPARASRFRAEFPDRIGAVTARCFASMLSAHLKAAPPDNSPAIIFPPSTAQKWILPNGLTIIVQEDRSAPVASVQAWCGTGSVDEDEHLGAGLSHILEHMLFKGTKTQPGECDRAKDSGRGRLHQRLHFVRSHRLLDRCAEGRRRASRSTFCPTR